MPHGPRAPRVQQVHHAHSLCCHVHRATAALDGSSAQSIGSHGQHPRCCQKTASNAAHLPRYSYPLHANIYGAHVDVHGVLCTAWGANRKTHYFGNLLNNNTCRFAACTPYTSFKHMRHRRTQLVADALHTMDTMIPTTTGHGAGCPDGRSEHDEHTPMADASPRSPDTPCTPTTPATPTPAHTPSLPSPPLSLYDRQHAERVLHSMAANMHSGWWGLRLFAYALSWLYRLVELRNWCARL